MGKFVTVGMDQCWLLLLLLEVHRRNGSIV